MRVMVLGHRGMLGHVVARWLTEQKYDVVTTDTRYTGSPQDELIQVVKESRAIWVVNCIARIDQKRSTPAELHLANAILPQHLKLALLPEQKLIHASTDGVFSGIRGNYRSTDQPDPIDAYGLSKLLGESVGENNRCFVIRTSIIGLSLDGNSGLMSWLLSQKGSVNGYTNHFWNGITTLEWAKVCEEIIVEKEFLKAPLIHVGSANIVSKHDLLASIAQAWKQDIIIRPIEAAQPLDRSLIADLPRDGIRRQLEELREWLDRI